MKKLKEVDVFGYQAHEFDDWLKRSVKKMLKRTQKRESPKGMQASLGAPEQRPRQNTRRKRAS